VSEVVIPHGESGEEKADSEGYGKSRQQEKGEKKRVWRWQKSVARHDDAQQEE